jgi:hypothetical protein
VRVRPRSRYLLWLAGSLYLFSTLCMFGAWILSYAGKGNPYIFAGSSLYLAMLMVLAPSSETPSVKEIINLFRAVRGR